MNTTPLAIRPDLIDGHAHAWDRIARPGTWWTGAERVAIAQASRDAWSCALCDLRKASLSPNAGGDDVTHDSEGCDALSAAAIDTVHRIVRDQGRLSREWLDALIASKALTSAQYVELIGVVTQAVSIDTFQLAAGLDLDPLPAPIEGEPSRYTPPGLAMEKAWVPMIATKNLGPNEQDLYAKTGNVVRSMSSVPDEVRAMKALSSHQYLSMPQMRDFVGGESVNRGIDRAQMELIAGRVSALHECFY